MFGLGKPKVPKDRPPPDTLIGRLRSGLAKTRAQLGSGLSSLFNGRQRIDAELIEDIETQLLSADVGMTATQQIIDTLQAHVKKHGLSDPSALPAILQQQLTQMLARIETPLATQAHKPFVILVVGVNGVGKTTTIAKLAYRYQQAGQKVLLAAGDTFRAAAVEQLQSWGERHDTPVIAQHTGADSASVLYDALAAAKSRGSDILIADTAGRLHNKDNLMNELEKVVRVLRKLDPEAPHEVLLVLDAGTGQNAIQQTRQFQQAVGVTGLALTKMDGTAKGGVIFALAQEFALPVRFIGVGEQAEDLQPFVAEEFCAALFQSPDETA